MFKNSNLIPQLTTLSIPPVLNESAHFDPLISTDNGNLQDLETLFAKVKADETQIDAEAENIMKTDVSKQKPVSIKDLFNNIN